MRAQIIGRKNYRLDYASRGTSHIDTPGSSSVFITTKDIKAKISKQNKKHRGLGFEKCVIILMLVVSTSKATPQS